MARHFSWKVTPKNPASSEVAKQMSPKCCPKVERGLGWPILANVGQTARLGQLAQIRIPGQVSLEKLVGNFEATSELARGNIPGDVASNQHRPVHGRRRHNTLTD